MAITKRVAERVTKAISKFQEVLRIAKDRDVNETDTVAIIKDVLAEVFGYDKYIDLTSEVCVRGNYCDIGIKVDDKVEFLLEAKAIGLSLKDNHLRQAIDYGANNGIQWVILTNGIEWHLHRIRFEQPINNDLICSVNLLEADPSDEEILEKLFTFTKEGLTKDARDDYHEKIQTLNRFTLGAILLGEDVVSLLRRELRKLSDGVLVEPEAILKVLTNEVLKREVLEGEEATKAQSRVRRFYNRQSKKAQEQPTTEAPTQTPVTPQTSPPQPAV
jgi:predicted type IV restriction endonuclease